MRNIGITFFAGLAAACFAVLLYAYEGHAAKPFTKPLEVQPLTSAEMIRPRQVIGDGTPQLQPQRCGWYRSRLGPYASIINAAARETGIPPQLLAAIVLNELADVGMEDVAQDQQMASTGGDFRLALDPINRPMLSYKPIGQQSFGIAQINPATAIRHNAVPIAGQERLSRDYVEYQIAYQLLNRPMAVHAAARVIRGILKDLELRYQDSPWASQFMLRDRRFSAADPYAGVNPPASGVKRTSDREKEVTLTYLVTSIYNTDTIVEAVPRDTPRAHDLGNPKGFGNALNHASTTRVIAWDLFESGGCGMGLLSFEEIKKQRGMIGTGPAPGSGGWIVWYGEKMGYQPFFITAKSTYEKNEPSCNYPGGGMDCSLIIQKTYAGGPYATREDAIKAICGTLTKFRRLSGIYAGLLVADYNGKMHNVENIGTCGH
jgi:hypothetical protein